MGILSRITGQQLPTVDVTTAHDRPRRVLLVDVREPSEWAEGHAPHALHRPLGRLDPAALPKAETIYVICRSGNRSARATKALVAAGLDAHNVAGGMSAWEAARLPVSRD
jgi:Rhodanese-related sulfurtransferase